MTDFITSGEFAAAMQKLPGALRIAVAVSGGGDSMALAVLMKEWAAAQEVEMLALTVDHQLRPESSAEAAATAKALALRGIKCDILPWHGEKPATHIQERAREVRYKLLLAACRRHGCGVLALAHNQEDQIETLWMRLAHGSGLDGLAGMAAVRDENGVTLIRPLLGFSRERLRATCRRHGLNWIEDPSNANEKYLRARLRMFEDMLGAEGLTPVRLGQTLQKLEDARQALQAVAENVTEACLQTHAEGYATLHLHGWKTQPADIQRRVLAASLRSVFPQGYAAGFEAVEQLRLDLGTSDFAGRTLAGCEIIPGPDGTVLILREAAGIEGRAAVTAGFWDGRFLLSGFSENILEIGALGDQGVSELRKNKTSFPAAWEHLESLHFKVRRVLPALWRQENLIAVPGLGYYSQECPSEARTGTISAVSGGR